jgi:hypothetical protein
MREAAMEQLTVWGNFYAIVGTAAATLTGLMFIAVTLISREQLQIPRSSDALGAFSTPTIVHFASALGVAAMLAAPWRVLWQPGLLLGLVGLAGALYMLIVARRTHRQTAYTPVLEDQLWHMVFPLAAYGALVVAALVFAADATPALFIAGAATMLFLFVGIHNAWDNVTYLVLRYSALEQDGQAARAGSESGREQQ